MKLPVEHRQMIRDSLRIYFAPLVGAYRAVRSEWRKGNREMAKCSRSSPQEIKHADHM